MSCVWADICFDGVCPKFAISPQRRMEDERIMKNPPEKKHKVILFVDKDEEDEMTFGALVRIPSCRVGWFLNHDNGPAK